MAGFGSDKEHIDIAIIGAGIGGAATAVALQQAGFDADVFEQASQLREIGGGIVFREPSRALFARWGILDDLRPKLAAVNVMEIRARTGSVLNVAPAATEAGETHCAHRADVHNALISKLSAARLHLGHRLVSIENGFDYAEATFENGRRIRARLIVGADGLRSIVRTLLDATPMSFLKQVTNRTIAPASLLPADIPNDRIRIWQDGMRRLISLPIRNGTEITLNFAFGAEKPPDQLWYSMSADALMPFYTDFDPLVTRLLEGRIAPITSHAIYDKEPITQWADRHIVLLGDAAHPMSPMNGQGANQAIQDGGALAAALSGRYPDDLTSALADYQSVRAPATARIQMLSRKPPPSLVGVAPAAK